MNDTRKTRRTVASLAPLIALAALAGLPGRSFADIVIMNDGTRLEGIATTSSAMPDFVIFSDHVNESLRLPTNRVEKIISEPEVTSRLRIAKAFARQGKYEQALTQLREAKRLAPDDPAVLEEESAVQEALAARNAQQSEMQVEENRGLLDKIRLAMKNEEFEKATIWFAMLEDESVPIDIRREAQELKARFYQEWGDYKADRTDTFGAIEAYEIALDVEPENEALYKKLMRMYEKIYRPGSTDETRTRRLQEYLESQVEREPDNLDARLRLANLLYLRRNWDEALNHYLAAYNDPKATGTLSLSLPRVESRMFALLDMQHREAAKRADYAAAIENFKELQAYFPSVDPEPLYRYEYQQRANALGEGDVKDRVELIRFAENYGLDDAARRQLDQTLQIDPDNEQVREIAERWAREDLQEIETAFNSGMYAQIEGLVAQLENKYPEEEFANLEPIRTAAESYVERARIEARAQAREKKERAEALAQTADENFERGITSLRFYREGAGTSYSGYRDSGRNFTARVGSYKSEAIAYFERAKRYYREALALDPTLADPAKGDLKRKLASTQNYLNLLKSQRIPRTPPGPRSSRRFRTSQDRFLEQFPYASPYYPYGNYPYVQPVVPYPGGPGYPVPSPYLNPYNPYNRTRP